jgi:hypothetical protein
MIMIGQEHPRLRKDARLLQRAEHSSARYEISSGCAKICLCS